MKKKILKTLLSTMVMVSLLGTTCFADDFTGEMTATTGQEITGTSEIKNPIYSVVIPTKFEFSVDAFSQGGQSQIYSEEFNIINKSNVAVRVNVNAKATPLKSATLKTAEADVTETSTDKLMYLAIQTPSTVTISFEDKAAFTPALLKGDAAVYYTATTSENGSENAYAEMQDVKGVTSTYDASAKEALSTEGKDFLFALAKAEYVDYYTNYNDTAKTGSLYKKADADNGATTFRFYGKVNSKAAWETGEVKVDATYTFLGLSDANYGALKDKVVTNAHAYVVEDTFPQFSSSAAGVISYVDGSTGNELYSVTKLVGPWGDTTFDAASVENGITLDKDAKTITILASNVSNWANKYSTDTDGKLDFEITYTCGTNGATTKTTTVSVVIFTPGE